LQMAYGLQHRPGDFRDRLYRNDEPILIFHGGTSISAPNVLIAVAPVWESHIFSDLCAGAITI
jgi:hypothetical protein